MKLSREWRQEALGAVLLVALVLLPRVLALDADPPPDISDGVLTDEGWWAHNARQQALFGQWVMDSDQTALIATPLYSVALAGLYHLVGVGIAETRLLSAIAGSLTCVLVYLVLRTMYPLRQALPPALVLGTSYLMLSYNRVAFTESFQLLFIVATFAAVLRSTYRAPWALAGGLCFILSLLAKPSAVIFAPILVGFWLVHWWASRRRGLSPTFSFRQPAFFVAAAAAASIPVIILFGLHHEVVRARLAKSLSHVYQPQFDARILFLGWDGLGLTPNGFFLQTALPILVVTAFAIARIGRVAKKPVDLTELFCWTWVALGLLFLAAQRYQPDRRFLLLLPPVAILATFAVQQEGAVLPGSVRLTGPPWGWRRWLIGGLLGGVIGFYLLILLEHPVVALAAKWGWRPSGDDLSLATKSILWSVSTAGGAILAGAGAVHLSNRSFRVPALPVVLLFVILEPARFALYTRHLNYTLRDASREIATLSAAWPARERLMVGWLSDTFALETNLLASRSSPRAPREDSIQVSLVLTSALPDGDEKGEGELTPQFARYREFAIWPDRQGVPRRTVTLYVKQGLCEGCQRP